MNNFLGKVRYLGPDLGVDGLFNNNIYKVVEIDALSGALRILDESGEDYLYSPVKPKLLSDKYQGGKFIVVEDDPQHSLEKAISMN